MNDSRLVAGENVKLDLKTMNIFLSKPGLLSHNLAFYFKIIICYMVYFLDQFV